MQDVLVLYPSAGMGHIVAMVELGKLLLRHNNHHRFSVTILLTTGYWDTNGVLSYIDKISLTHPSITFLRFPTVTVEPPSITRSPAAALFEFIRLHAVNARRSLEEISKTSNVRAFIIDMFCTSALSIGKELQIPTYYFYTSGAGAFTAFLHFPALNKEFENQSYKDLTTTVLQFPAAVPPLKATQMPEPMLDRNDLAHHNFSWFCASLPLANGVIINSFEELEVSQVKALLENKCFIDKSKATPPVYCIGPLIADSEAKPHDCLKWLDAQPKRSVLFLCFGSRGSFAVPQLKQIAEGLERSGVRFLWIVKAPPFDEKRKQSEADNTDFELEEILPAGFMNRVNDRAMVVKSWVPQIQVLNHESVGGFVTHCGWNSVLEAVVAGVPMVAWPLYAEQHLNRNLLVEEMKMAVGVEQRDEDGFVTGEEVEKRVRELMTSTKLDEKSKVMRDLAMAALGESGSSTIALARFVRSWSK